MTLATLVLAITTSSCTFCYQTSKFERECQERGGHVHTFNMTQTQVCVFDKNVVEFEEEDSGSALTLEPECLAVGRPCEGSRTE